MMCLVLLTHDVLTHDVPTTTMRLITDYYGAPLRHASTMRP